MDQLLVDVTDMEGVAPGDTATLIGRDGDAVLTAEEAAQLDRGHMEYVCRTPRGCVD